VRFFAGNLINSGLGAVLTCSNQTPAISGGVQYFNQGAVNFQVTGTYTGTNPLATYRWEIQVAGANGDFSGTLWRWSDTNGVVWNASGLTTVNTVYTVLNNGLSSRWFYGFGTPPFVQGDIWIQTFFRPYPVQNLLDLARNTEMRTGSVLSSGVVDWSVAWTAAQTIPAVIIYDHNFPAGSTIQFQTSTTSNFAVLTSNLTIPYAAGKIVYLVASPVSAQYARLRVTSGAAVSYLRMSELYFGTVTTMSKEFAIGFSAGVMNQGPLDLETLMRGQAPLGLQARFYELRFPLRLDTAGQDIDLLEQLWLTIHDPLSLSKKPFYFVQDTITPVMFDLVHWNADRFVKENVFLSRYNAPIPLVGVARTAA
jgi:hypothetical protein